MWYEKVYDFLQIFTLVVGLVFVLLPTLQQIFYMLFSGLKKKTFPKSSKKAKIGVVIPAHNEESVIYDTIRAIYEKQNYPKDLITILVVCHNCTDKTAALAKKAGAIVEELNNDDPKTHICAVPLKYGFQWFLDHDDGYELFFHLDADNTLNDDFFSLMNDAYQSGVQFGRPYESSKNTMQSIWSKTAALYYACDSRMASRVRERFHMGAQVNGPGSMFSKELMSRTGYDCVKVCDDYEYLLKRHKENVFGHFVEDAVVYEDQPATMRETFYREKRSAAGNRELFFSVFSVFFRFFYKFKMSYIDVAYKELLQIVSIVSNTYINLWLIYKLIFTFLCGIGVIPNTYGNDFYMTAFWGTLIVSACFLLFLTLILFWLQALILVCCDKEKLGIDKKRKMIDIILLYPFTTMFYSFSMFIGFFSKRNWKAMKRNVVSNTDINSLLNENNSNSNELEIDSNQNSSQDVSSNIKEE